MTRALVVSGGGSKGAFAVGVVRKLSGSFPRLTFDRYVGTSTGSLIVPLVALGELDLLEKLYTTVTTENIIEKFNIGDRINERSIFGANPLWDLIGQYYTDQRYQQLLDDGRKIYLNTTCLQTGQLVVFTTDTNPAVSQNYEVQLLRNADHFRRAVMASACQPVFMPPVQVNSNVAGHPHPNYQFVDGGVREYAGIEMAIDNGATEIVTILLSAGKQEEITTAFSTLFPILQQTIDIFTLDVAKNDLIIPRQYNEALEYIDAVKRKMRRAGLTKEQIDDYFRVKGRESPYQDKVPLKLFTIRPQAPLGGGPGGLLFDPAEMKEMVSAGQQAASGFLAALRPADTADWS